MHSLGCTSRARTRREPQDVLCGGMLPQLHCVQCSCPEKCAASRWSWARAAAVRCEAPRVLRIRWWFSPRGWWCLSRGVVVLVAPVVTESSDACSCYVARSQCLRGRVDGLPCAFRGEMPVLGGTRPSIAGIDGSSRGSTSDCTAHSAGCTVQCAAPRTARNSSRSTASRPRLDTGCPVDGAPPYPPVPDRDPVPRPTNCTARKAESHTAAHHAHVWPGSR